MASVDMFAWSGFIVSMKNIIKPGTQGFMYPDSGFPKQYQQIPVCDPMKRWVVLSSGASTKVFNFDSLIQCFGKF